MRGVRAAFLWQFDDGYDNVYTNGFPYLQARGQKATMYLNGALGGTIRSRRHHLAHLQALYDAGWVIGNHTIDHTDLTTVSQAVATDKVLEGYEWLIEHGFTRGARHFAYPNFNFSDSAVAAVQDAGMLTARIDSERNQQLPLDDPFRLTCIEPRNGYDYAVLLRARSTAAIASGSTVFFLLHTVQPADGLAGHGRVPRRAPRLVPDDRRVVQDDGRAGRDHAVGGPLRLRDDRRRRGADRRHRRPGGADGRRRLRHHRQRGAAST